MTTGFDYVGAGNSTTKKDAQANAASDFVQYLIRQGVMNPKEVPNTSNTNSTGNLEQSIDCSTARAELNFHPNSNAKGKGTILLIFLILYIHTLSLLFPDYGNAYHPVTSSSNNQTTCSSDSINAAQEVVEAELVDFNASIHGGWTMENAKSKLHQFFQENHINTDYKFSAIGPDHNK